jgi:hypothetical protein
MVLSSSKVLSRVRNRPLTVPQSSRISSWTTSTGRNVPDVCVAPPHSRRYRSNPPPRVTLIVSPPRARLLSWRKQPKVVAQLGQAATPPNEQHPIPHPLAYLHRTAPLVIVLDQQQRRPHNDSTTQRTHRDRQRQRQRASSVVQCGAVPLLNDVPPGPPELNPVDLLTSMLTSKHIGFSHTQVVFFRLIFSSPLFLATQLLRVTLSTHNTDTTANPPPIPKLTTTPRLLTSSDTHTTAFHIP